MMLQMTVVSTMMLERSPGSAHMAYQIDQTLSSSLFHTAAVMFRKR